MADETTPVNYYNMSVPQGMMQGKAELIDKINPEAVANVILHRLLGQAFIDGKWTNIDALKESRLTEVGAWEISNEMLGSGSLSMSISKLNDNEVKNRLRRIAKTTQLMLLSKYDAYGIKSVAQFYHIHDIVFSNTLAVLKQADEASIQELLKSVVYENRNVTSAPKEKSTNKISRALGLSD